MKQQWSAVSALDMPSSRLDTLNQRFIGVAHAQSYLVSFVCKIIDDYTGVFNGL